MLGSVKLSHKRTSCEGFPASVTQAGAQTTEEPLSTGTLMECDASMDLRKPLGGRKAIALASLSVFSSHRFPRGHPEPSVQSFLRSNRICWSHPRPKTDFIASFNTNRSRSDMSLNAASRTTAKYIAEIQTSARRPK